MDQLADKSIKNRRETDLALADCLNKFAVVDISYIAKATSLPPEQVITELKGIIYQNPAVFEGTIFYDRLKGWELAPKFLSGNIIKKYNLAKRLNKRYYGVFDESVQALESVLPDAVDFNDIYINIGAPWIHENEYKKFICEFLNIPKCPDIIFDENANPKYRIGTNTYAKNSVLNNRTYAVRRDNGEIALTALQIFEATLNSKTVEINDYELHSNGKKSKKTNESKTIEVRETQELFNESFRNWVRKDNGRMDRFQTRYCECFGGYRNAHYNGRYIKHSDLNPNVHFRPYQNDFISRFCLTEGNLIMCYDTGTGKSFVFPGAAHEYKRLHPEAKIMIVVPNHLLSSAVKCHQMLYKNDKLLTIDNKSFTKAKRNKVLEEIRDGNYDAVYIRYSCFDEIKMSKSFLVNKLASEIKRLHTLEADTTNDLRKVMIKNRIHSLVRRLDKLKKEYKQTEWMSYDELGIDVLFVDEVQNYKNIPIETNSKYIIGLNKEGSEKCGQMVEKVHCTKRVCFATATPITNSISDLYAIQYYLQPETLKYHNIDNFDAWINTFGKRITEEECDKDPNSKKLRTVTRFSQFNNLSELLGIFSQICDFHFTEDKDVDLPKYSGHINVAVPSNPLQEFFIKALSERAEKIRNHEVDRKEDNMLKVTIDGWLAALDIRLVDTYKSLKLSLPSKTLVCARKVKEIYDKYPGTSQIVFCDLGIPKSGFNIYDELKSLLITSGIKEKEIAYVHDAVSEAAKLRLYKQINEGTIRVVIGSTQKLGTGVNIQKKLIALHHLSIPWRPADMIQREGRILRSGNTCEEVFIFCYYTEGTFDSFSWQLLENKQRFIVSFLSGTCPTREIKDLSNSVLSYAEVKMLSIGNPLIKKRIDTGNRLERTKIAFKEREKELVSLKNFIAISDENRKKVKRQAELTADDFRLYTENKCFISKADRQVLGEKLLNELKQHTNSASPEMFGTYKGFNIEFPAFMSADKPYFYIKSPSNEYIYELDSEITPIGVTIAIDLLLARLNKASKKLYDRYNLLGSQIEDAKADLASGNRYEYAVIELENELRDIDKEIAAAVDKAG